MCEPTKAVLRGKVIVMSGWLKKSDLSNKELNHVPYRLR
jgi:hypothetical protein